MSIRHFIVIYDIPGREAEVLPFENDYAAALARYEQLEQEHRQDPDVEVVMLGSDSVEAIRKTHSSYFDLHGEHISAWVERELTEALG
jgi:hypothetical protein